MGNSYNNHGESFPIENNQSPGFFGKMFQGFTNLNKKAFSAVLSYVSPFMLDRPVFTTWNTEEAIKQGYIASHVVHACIKYRAGAAACVPWIVEQKTPGGVWKRVLDHPLENLIEHPNSIQERAEFIYRLSVFLDVCGNAIIYKSRFKKEVLELIPIQPDRIRPIPDKKKFIGGYQFSPSGSGFSSTVDKNNIIKSEDVIHWMYPNPANPFWGVGPLQTVGRVVDTEVEALRFQKSSLQNKCVKDGILSFKKHLNKAQWELINDEFMAQVTGPDNARGPIIIGEEATYQPFSMTPAEMDFINSRKMSREDICIAFLVPPPLLGILEHSSYANSDAARVIFWLDTMIPQLELIAAGFNRSLVPDYGDKEKLRVNFDLSQVRAMGEAFDKTATTARKLFEVGYPINVINNRLQMGMPPIEGGDNSYIPGNLMVPAEIPIQGQEEEKPSPKTPPKEETKPDKEEKKSLPDCCFPDDSEKD